MLVQMLLCDSSWMWNIRMPTPSAGGAVMARQYNYDLIMPGAHRGDIYAQVKLRRRGKVVQEWNTTYKWMPPTQEVLEALNTGDLAVTWHRKDIDNGWEYCKVNLRYTKEQTNGEEDTHIEEETSGDYLRTP